MWLQQVSLQQSELEHKLDSVNAHRTFHIRHLKSHIHHIPQSAIESVLLCSRLDPIINCLDLLFRHLFPASGHLFPERRILKQLQVEIALLGFAGHHGTSMFASLHERLIIIKSKLAWVLIFCEMAGKTIRFDHREYVFREARDLLALSLSSRRGSEHEKRNQGRDGSKTLHEQLLSLRVEVLV